MTQKTDGCWLWLGTKDRRGYGRIWMKLDGRLVQLAHRAAFILVRGYHPPELDHLCRNPSCVRPEHLDPCGQIENAKRQAWPNHCPHGHEFTPANTGHYTSQKGYRVRLCRVCRSETVRRSNALRGARRAA